MDLGGSGRVREVLYMREEKEEHISRVQEGYVSTRSPYPAIRTQSLFSKVRSCSWMGIVGGA